MSDRTVLTDKEIEDATNFPTIGVPFGGEFYMPSMAFRNAAQRCCSRCGGEYSVRLINGKPRRTCPPCHLLSARRHAAKRRKCVEGAQQ
jgi:hypothetical protein